MAAFMRVAVMLCIVDVLVLVHFPVMIMRMGMLVSGMATHRLSPPLPSLLYRFSYIFFCEENFRTQWQIFLRNRGNYCSNVVVSAA